jgi:hypothetical protein
MLTGMEFACINSSVEWFIYIDSAAARVCHHLTGEEQRARAYYLISDYLAPECPLHPCCPVSAHHLFAHHPTPLHRLFQIQQESE